MRPTYKTTCPGCGKEHLVKPVEDPGDPDPLTEGYENMFCQCGTVLEFYELGLSQSKARWTSVEGFETEAKLDVHNE
jgi:hypothetical protein